MRQFIERVVSLAPDAFVLAIAVGQLLVAISWPGVGAAFPTNLVLAAGVLLLLRRS